MSAARRETGAAPKARLRVLVFLPCLTLGGAERQALLVASFLRDRGHDVQMWGFPSPHGRPTLVPEIERRGLPWRELPAWPSIGWDYARFGPLAPAARWWKWSKGVARLEAELPRDRTFDVLVPYTFWPSLAACLMGERLGARRWFWNHRGGYDPAGILYSGFLVRKILAHRPRFVANSREGARFVSHTFGLAPDEVAVVPNAFVSESAPSAGRDASGVLTLLHVANVYPEKDYDTLLEGMRLLRDGGIPFRLEICGEFLHDADRARFEDRVRTLGLGGQVRHHGPVTRAAVLELAARADIGLLSSRSEGQPNSVMEFMHAGLPVVGTRIPGIRELVGEDGEEWLFDVGDAAGLARAVGRLAADPALRGAIGDRHRRRLLERYAPETVLPRWAELVEAV